MSSGYIVYMPYKEYRLALLLLLSAIDHSINRSLIQVGFEVTAFYHHDRISNYNDVFDLLNLCFLSLFFIASISIMNRIAVGRESESASM